MNTFQRSWWTWWPLHVCTLDISDSMTIVIISVIITIVIVKNYYRDSGHVVSAMCIWHCPVSTHPQPHEKHAKMVRNISDEIDLDKELEVFLMEGFNSDVREYLVFLLQVENAQNLYPIFSFTIVIIVFTVVQVSIKYRDS